MTSHTANPSLRRRSRWRAFTLVSLLGAVASGLLLPDASFGAHVARADPTSASSAFTQTEAIGRTALAANGSETSQDKRNFTLNVDRTTGLRNLDGIDVTWSGAHPSTNIYPDFNNSQGRDEQYPVVLLECRGVESPAAGQTQVSPSTCWTDDADERSALEIGTDFPAWRLDRYAAAADGTRPPQFDGIPTVSSACQIDDPTEAQAAYGIPIDGANGTVYDGAISNNCGTLAPEELELGYPQGDPDNLTWGTTNADGTGSAVFRVWTQDTNATLGCSDTVVCSLVAVPIEGISCNESRTPESDGSAPSAADIAACETSTDAVGVYNSNPLAGAPAIDGELWWSPSNWRNRVVVPLNFNAQLATCTSSSNGTVYAYGSELMDQVAPQWSAEFCTDPNYTPFNAVAAPEPQAASQLASGQIEAALLTNPPPAGTPTEPIVMAPVAITGWTIAIDIDTTDHKPVPTIKLDARLLAKLLTWSYYDDHNAKSDPAVAGNPANISVDPEFEALNPGLYVVQPDFGNRVAASLLTLSTESDVVYALTSYINADPEARAWLNGTPDPWGMTVNSNYKGIQLPVNIWPLLDSYIPYLPDQTGGTSSPYTADPSSCLHYTPTPYQQLVADPETRLTLITLNMLAHQPNSHFQCSSSGLNTVGIDPAQGPGYEFMVGTITAADAARYGLAVAQLEAQSSASTTAQFTDSTGRTFVGPTDAGMQAAADTMTKDTTSGAWTLDYGALRNNAAGASAYPGTMVVSLAVLTSGLPSADAQAYSKILSYAAGSGQIPGTGNGELPPGYVPMTSANGLGAMAADTMHDASTVAAQLGASPSPSPSPSPSLSPSPSASPSTSASATASSSAAPTTAAAAPPAVGGAARAAPIRQTGSTPTSQTSTSPTPAPAAAPAPSAVASVPLSPAPTVSLAAAVTPNSPVGRLGFLLPILLLVSAGGGTLALIVETVAAKVTR